MQQNVFKRCVDTGKGHWHFATAALVSIIQGETRGGGFKAKFWHKTRFSITNLDFQRKTISRLPLVLIFQGKPMVMVSGHHAIANYKNDDFDFSTTSIRVMQQAHNWRYSTRAKPWARDRLAEAN